MVARDVLRSDPLELVRGEAREKLPGEVERLLELVDEGERAAVVVGQRLLPDDPDEAARPCVASPIRARRARSSLRVALTCSFTKPQALSVGRSRSASPSSLVDLPINVDEGHHGHRGGRDTITERRWLRRVGPGGSTLGEASGRRHDEHGHRS